MSSEGGARQSELCHEQFATGSERLQHRMQQVSVRRYGARSGRNVSFRFI